MGQHKNSQGMKDVQKEETTKMREQEKNPTTVNPKKSLHNMSFFRELSVLLTRKAQGGFRPGRSCIDHIATTQSV